MIMFFAMLVNILIARLTLWKFIFLTGHHTLFMSMMVAAILSAGGMSGIPLIAVGSLAVGVTMVLFPALAHPYMKQITGSDDVALGHFSTCSYVLAGWIGAKIRQQGPQQRRGAGAQEPTVPARYPGGHLLHHGHHLPSSPPPSPAPSSSPASPGKHWFMFS